MAVEGMVVEERAPSGLWRCCPRCIRVSRLAQVLVILLVIALIVLVIVLSVTLSLSLYESPDKAAVHDPTPPRLLLQPLPDGNDSDGDGPLIKLSTGNRNAWKPLVEKLERSVEAYKTPSPFAVSCDSNNRPSTDRSFCHFDVNILGICRADVNFGYDVGRPCVMLTLSNVENWVPMTYKPSAIPEDAPDMLKLLLTRARPDDDMIYLSCAGRAPVDEENLGPVTYYPTAGFRSFYYPYRNVPGHLPPVVMVQFARVQRGVVVHVECEAWAANLNATHRFMLLVD